MNEVELAHGVPEDDAQGEHVGRPQAEDARLYCSQSAFNLLQEGPTALPHDQGDARQQQATALERDASRKEAHRARAVLQSAGVQGEVECLQLGGVDASASRPAGVGHAIQQPLEASASRCQRPSIVTVHQFEHSARRVVWGSKVALRREGAGVAGAARVEVAENDAAVAACALDAHGEVGSHTAGVALSSAVHHGEGFGQAMRGHGPNPQAAVELQQPATQPRRDVVEQEGSILSRHVAEGVTLVPVGNEDAPALCHPVGE